MTDETRSTMDREEHPHLLPWYVTGEIGAADRHRIEEHLAGCETCRDEAASLRSLRRTMNEAELLDGHPAERSAEARAAEGSADAVAARRPAVKGWWWLAAAATLVLGVTIVAVPWTELGSPENPALAPLESVTLLPQTRRSEEEIQLPGTGPWALTIVLPLEAPGDRYHVRIRRDGSLILESQLNSDPLGNLTLLLTSLPGPGSYRLQVDLPSDPAWPVLTHSLRLAEPGE